METKTESISLIELPAYSKRLLARCKDRTVILLNGPLGSGKTQLVKTCVRLLGGDTAESPTFSIINEYTTKIPVYHIDLYRLESLSDIDSTGFWDLFELNQALIFIEWAERIDIKEIPLYWQKINVHMDFTDQETRRILKTKEN